MDKVIYADKRFLNNDGYHSIAAVSGRVKLDETGAWEPIIADMTLSDCSRVITLDLDTDSLESLENSIHKARQIEEVARGVKEKLIESRPIIEAWVKEQEEKKNKD